MIGKFFLVLAGLAVVVGIATVWRIAATAAKIEAEYPPEGNFVEVDGTRLHYVQTGSGPDLVLIHGASGSTRDWTFRMMDALSDRYRVTAFDRPAFGYSERVKGASIGDQAALLRGAAEALGLSEPIILGQSYGGAVALAWALQAPDIKALVLLSSVSQPWETGIGSYYQLLSSPPGQAILAPLLSAWVPETTITGALDEIFEPNAVPEGYADHIGPRMSLRLPGFRENALERRALLAEITAQAPRYRTLTMPVELLHGDTDTIVPAHIHSIPLAEQLPNGNLTLLPGIGHMPHHVAMDEVIAAIDRAALR